MSCSQLKGDQYIVVNYKCSTCGWMVLSDMFHDNGFYWQVEEIIKNIYPTFTEMNEMMIECLDHYKNSLANDATDGLTDRQHWING